jgi:rfaE bifunctional protein kinase chain/domain
MSELKSNPFEGIPLLVVGDVMLDRTYRGAVERISPEAPVPVLRVQSQDDRPGGAANVARNLSSIGARPVLLGLVGDDEPGHRVRSLLASEGVEDALLTAPGLQTTVKMRAIGRQQQLLRLDFEGQPSQAVMADKQAAFHDRLTDAALVVLSDYGKGALGQARQLIEAARASGRRVLVDPKGDDYARYTGASLLTPNYGEFVQAVGRPSSESDMASRAERLCGQLGLDHLLVTRSEDGMTLFTPGEGPLHVPAQAREVFDVTGAGDTVIAVLAAAWAAGLPLPRAVQLANAAAGIVVGRLGTATVSWSDLQTML